MLTDPYLHVRNPLQYLDGEVNASRRDFDSAEVRIALVFPDLYELGMSHLGLKILYEVLNGREGYLAERAFAPAADREAQIRRLGIPLASLESGRPLAEFDAVGFTLPYELTCTNILNILDLAGIPLLAADREDRHPLVGGGGPGAANPEPLADFFDFILFGDGEEAILEIASVLSGSRSQSREEKLLRLGEIRGVYIPSFYRPVYGGDGRFQRLEPLRRSAPGRIRKRVLHDLDSAPHPVHPPVPYLETTHDRVTVEIARGCIQRCRFCQAGTAYRPYRERSPAVVLDMAEKGLASTGYDELSLASLSCGDYRHLEPLLAELMDRYREDRVSISLPSLRPGTVTEGVLREIRKVKRTGFTIAPEAGSQRLRDVISKGVTEEQVMETCSRLFKEGWNRVKLYFMVGLPTETPEDREAIVELAAAIRQLGRRILGKPPHVSASISPFVPKAHTPFQWARQLTPSELHPVLDGLRQRLKRRGISFKWHQPELSALEGAISRGDRRMAAVLRRAWEKGRTFDGWSESFEFAPWLEAFREHGMDLYAHIGRERSTEEALPWDHLCPPDLRNFLVQESERARGTVPTPACDPTECPSCGLCEEHPGLDGDTAPIAKGRSGGPRPTPAPGKVRMEFAKFGRMKYLPHLSLMRTFHRALRRARIPLAYSQGHTPHPRIQVGPPLPLGYEGDREYIDVETYAVFSPAELARTLGPHLPEGLEIRQAVSAPPGGASLFDAITLQVYRVVIPKEQLPDGETGEWLLARILDAEQLTMERTRKGRTRTVDLRPAVAGAELIGEDDSILELLLSIHRTGGTAPRPGDIVRVACGFGAEEEFAWKITRTANLIEEDGHQYSPISLPPAAWRRKKILTCRR